MGRKMIAAMAMGVALMMMADAAWGQVTALPRGVWRGWLESAGGELPFEMEFFEEGEGCSVAIINASDRTVLPGVAFDHSEVVIPIPHFDAELRGRLVDGGSRIDGMWMKVTRDGKRVEMPFHAVRGERRRFPDAAPPAEGVEITGKWKAMFAESGEAVGEFRLGEEPGTVLGTFLTPTGDFGHLSGVMDGRTLRLSTFDGAHAFLFTAEVQGENELSGEFISGSTWREAWTAQRDGTAAVPDGFSQVTWNHAVNIWHIPVTNSFGEIGTLEDELGGNTGLVVELMGTWCPNCVDAGRMLEELRREIPNPQMVQVVGVAFEYTPDVARSLKQIAAFKQHFGIGYPVLLGGVADRKKIPEVVKGLSEMRSFPTTIFARRDGHVIAVHSGFSGPATGEEHAKLREKFKRLMEECAQR